MLDEYPRPQLIRSSYISLNDDNWEYTYSKNKDIPYEFMGHIKVPFSMEAPINGINHILQPDEYLFYRLNFALEPSFILDRVILHFTAVDQMCEVFLNDSLIAVHIGGFLPFEVDIKPYLKENNTLIIRVRDFTDAYYLSRGKQKLNRGKIWYTPQSGIYLPVWMESVKEGYIENIDYYPDIDNHRIGINVHSSLEDYVLELDGHIYHLKANNIEYIELDDMKLWSPESPYLYYIKIRNKVDEVKSYFAMRKFSKEKVGEHHYFMLNNKRYFVKGVLDQGYYQEGLLTPPSDESYINDIGLMKMMGFNTLRKHIKIESLRYYYHCDRLGMIVFQDFVNGGENYKFSTIAFPLITNRHHDDHNYKKFSRENKEGREQAISEFKQTVNYLKNVPCIALWTIFNEGWGQFDSKSIYEQLLLLDSTRLYDHASGWHDQGISDIKSLHVYFKRVKLPKDSKSRIILLSECGGYNLISEGHMSTGVNYGYKKMKSKEALMDKYEEFIKKDIINNISKGLAGFIYTQLSDIEDECNGFITYDRQVVKVDVKRIKEINDKIKFQDE